MLDGDSYSHERLSPIPKQIVLVNFQRRNLIFYISSAEVLNTIALLHVMQFFDVLVCPSVSSKSTCSQQTKSICRCTNLFYQNPDFEKVVFDCFNIPGPPLINRSFEKHAGVQMRKRGKTNRFSLNKKLLQQN